MYGVFGKNNNHAASRIVGARKFPDFSFHAERRLPTHHGMKARKRFQFRNKNKPDPVK